MKKPLVIALAVLAIIVVFLIIGKKQGWIGNEYRQKVLAEKAQYRTITETITANGKIKPELEVKISSDVSGEIVDLLVQEGDDVKKGQVLARIQPDIYERHLEKMEASLKSAQANVAQSEANFEQKQLAFNRNEELWANKTISQAEYEQALADFNVAKASVASSKAGLRNAQASLNEARDNLSKTTIYAPMDGTVSKLNVEKGERVVGTAQFEGTELMIVANLHKMEVMVDVNENDIIRVGLYDTCLIEVDAYLKTKFKGVVTQIANSAKTAGISTDQITNFEVRVFILPESYAQVVNQGKNNRYPFRPGMSATVDIQTNTRWNILTVPIQSVTTRSDSTMTDSVSQVKADIKDERVEVVFVINEGKIEQRKVTPGIQDTKYIEIMDGIKEEEEVVSGPYSAIARKLKDGDLVEVTDKLFATGKK